MHRRASAALITLAACILHASIIAPSRVRASRIHPAKPAMGSVRIYPVRESDSDLEVSGMLPGLAPGAVGYVRKSDLTALPQITFSVQGDENFSMMPPARITGIALGFLAHALGAPQESDLIDATCTDKYRAHYPQTYLHQHRPILGLSVDGQDPVTWAQADHQRGVGRYFITHADFHPAFTVLSHEDEPQVPTSVVRIDFTTEALTYGPIMPRDKTLAGDGFVIARQNCLRCHNAGAEGGTKAGVDWSLLAMLARQQPDFFQRYVKDPKQISATARMPANAKYDDATVRALTIYFRSLADNTADSTGISGHDGND